MCGCRRYLLRPPALQVYRVNFKLPAGVTCERCFLRWYYLTGHVSMHGRCIAGTP